MKNLGDIEEILRENRLQDQNVEQSIHEVWQAVLKMRKERHKKSLLDYTRPWMWAMASFLVIGVCIFIMYLMAKS